MAFRPAYLQLLEDNVLQERVLEAQKHLVSCELCPRKCSIDRTKQKGVCGAGSDLIVSSFGPHMGEESVLVGRRGSGTIFFAHCNLRCVFCQNFDLSFGGKGYKITSERLAEIMLTLQDAYGCPNINLVTPTHFVPQILEAVCLAAEKGLKVPLVYNCGGYESLETLKLLDGIIDIYMPDFKYAQTTRGKRYSGVANYSQHAKVALVEMDRQVGGLQLSQKGLAQRGLLIRHLVLPGGLDDTKQVLSFIKGNLSPHCLVNLMDQYYPANKAHNYPEISARLRKEEYEKAYEFAYQLGLRLSD